MLVRPPDPSETDAIAALWHRTWHDAHADLAPASLTAERTLASFKPRVPPRLPNMRVTGPVGRPTGLCVIKNDELEQLYVAAEARRQGVAKALCTDAETRIKALGHARAFLACAMDNTRAAAFYAAQGWENVGTMDAALETGDGPFSLKVWRFEKAL